MEDIVFNIEKHEEHTKKASETNQWVQQGHRVQSQYTEDYYILKPPVKNWNSKFKISPPPHPTKGKEIGRYKCYKIYAVWKLKNTNDLNKYIILLN